MVLDTIEALKLLLDRSLHLQGRAQQLQPDTLLLESVPEFDSMGLVAVVSEIEERFGIIFDDDDLVSENFVTLASLADVIRLKLER